MNRDVTSNDLKQLYVPAASSHKGQNGRLLIIGGSHLFHAASLWGLQVASKIVDLVHYSSVAENNALVHELKKEFRNGIVIPRMEIESYIEEDDAILIGPGMVRAESSEIKNQKSKIKNMAEITKIKTEGLQTQALTNYLVTKYPHKQWVIDAGALQMIDVELIPKNAILTPHLGELERLWEKDADLIKLAGNQEISVADKAALFAKRHKCIVLVKGETDVAVNGGECDERICISGEVREIKGGNAGMTKGGTGDVLAGLIAALATKNDPFLSAICGSYINKQAGDSLFKKVGLYFNASDLADEIPMVMKNIV